MLLTSNPALAQPAVDELQRKLFISDAINMAEKQKWSRLDKKFSYIDLKDIIDGLKERLKTPSAIDQAAASLCGPATFIYFLASKRPKDYVKYVIDLFFYGKATIGNLTVEPSEACRRFNPKNKIHPVDWVSLASLKDSSNAFLNYDNSSDTKAGITLPHTLKSWFQKSGHNVINDTNLIRDESLSNLLDAIHFHKQHYSVCLFIGARALASGGLRPFSKFAADHWVILNSDIRINHIPAHISYPKGQSYPKKKNLKREKIEFSVYSWGRKNEPLNHSLDVGKFLEYYYGYIAVK